MVYQIVTGVIWSVSSSTPSAYRARLCGCGSKLAQILMPSVAETRRLSDCGALMWQRRSNSSRVIHPGPEDKTRRLHERQRATVTRPVLECLAQRTCACLDLSGERYQASGADRIFRPVRRAAQEHGDADGVQA